MILRDIPITDYHAANAVSNSKLKIFRERGPHYYRARFIEGKIAASPDTAALRFGRAFDAMLTEPEKFAEQFIVAPDDLDRRTKAGKEWAAANAAKAILDGDEAGQLRGMTSAILAHPLARQFVLEGERQVTVRGKHACGLELQTRPDLIGLAGKPWIADIKTTADLGDWHDAADPHSPRAGAPIWRYGYHRQGGIAQHLVHRETGKKTAHYLVVVEKAEPFRCAVFEMDDDALDCGWRSAERDLLRLARCVQSGDWSDGLGGAIRIAAPAWLLEADAREFAEMPDALQRAAS